MFVQNEEPKNCSSVSFYPSSETRFKAYCVCSKKVSQKLFHIRNINTKKFFRTNSSFINIFSFFVQTRRFDKILTFQISFIVSLFQQDLETQYVTILSKNFSSSSYRYNKVLINSLYFSRITNVALNAQ